MQSNQQAQVKKPYSKPMVTNHGAVEEVTLDGSGMPIDQGDV